MLNRFPLWKYLLILAVLAVAFVYSAPNLYPDDPAIQVTGASAGRRYGRSRAHKPGARGRRHCGEVRFDEQGRGGLVRLERQDDQLPAKDIVRRTLGDALRSTLHRPLQTGCAVSGLAHEARSRPLRRRALPAGSRYGKAIETRLNVSEGEVKSLLRKERVRYRSLPNLKDAVQLASPIRKPSAPLSR